MTRFHFFYAMVLIGFAFGIYAVVQHGQSLRAPPAVPSSEAASPSSLRSGVEPSASLFANVRENLSDPLSRFFIQLILIVTLARICGSLIHRFGQPAVIGEMLAGILLGPSLLGWVWPAFFHFVFPTSSLGTLRLLSQVGVCLFMFVVGMDLDLAHLRKQARTAVVVSQVSIVFPYLLGVTTSLFLFTSLAGANTTFLAFALFIGISMSITAFPVLARILEERGLTRTPLGATAIACAATDDVTAWTILAFVVAIVKAQHVLASLATMLLVVAFVALMWFGIKPAVRGWLDRSSAEVHTPTKAVMAAVLIFIFGSALVTDLIGVHALFGAFMAGVVMPSRGEFRQSLRVRLEHFSSVFLLPLFFAFTGLRTQIGLLNDPGSWLVCGALIFVATVGKLGGAMLTARVTGVNWLDSFRLGALMNTRGLVELIALNIGYDLGILSPRIFAMLVILALVTTALTGPLLTLADCLRVRRALEARAA
ncbi:MAG TPA: cation:proton antiporter [Patescibacteria group bacterium]|nr:cation:proton antiporter [Patescibacteria group bacterium]